MGNLVVVGADGSSSSLAAVETAAREARRRRADLRVVYALNWPVRSCCRSDLEGCASNGSLDRVIAVGRGHGNRASW
ncbi:universal stress protein [Streptomyces sp. NPDC000851]